MAGIKEELARYPLDIENAEEMERLIKQAHLINEHIGLLPVQIVPAVGQTVLDVGCGPGEWVLEMARNYPNCPIIGIDISQHMVAYGNACARIRQFPNARFEVADASRLLPFPSASIDLVHVRLATGFLLVSTWPLFLKECFRVLRPGGVLCSVEVENFGIVNSQALMRYSDLLTEYLRRGEHCFTAEGSQIGIMAMQAHLLQQSGLASVQQHMYVLNYSLGTALHAQIIEDYSTLMRLWQPALIRENLLSQEKLDLLYTQAMAETHADDFCGITMFQAVWGKKPA
jgi:ubiquinone/menaquinone biosynthesis C-methylase UbiE